MSTASPGRSRKQWCARLQPGNSGTSIRTATNCSCWREKMDSAAMRILILTRNFPPQSCGVGDYACRMAEALSGGGDDVVVLTEPAAGLLAPGRRSGAPLRELSLRGWRDLKPVLREIAEAAPER